MRPSRLPLVLIAALTAAGCTHTPAPESVAAQDGALAMPADLDSLAYARSVVPASYAQAPPPQGPSPQTQPPSRPQPTRTAMQAHAQAVLPVATQPQANPVYRLDTGDKLRIVVF